MDVTPDPHDVARQYGLAAVRTLVSALDSADTHVAVEAAIALLNFGHGLPLQRLAFDAGAIIVEVNAGESDAAHRANGNGAAQDTAHGSC
jgi:hypothetical protein